MYNSKVLIVGGAGFVGSNLSHYLLENYNITKLYIIDNLISADISNVPIQDNVEFIYGSITSDKNFKSNP